MYMETKPLAEVRANLSKVVDDAVRTHERVEITRNGVRAAVVMGIEDYDSLMETLDVLADADLVKDIGIALAELQEGDVLSTEEVLEGMPTSRRGVR